MLKCENPKNANKALSAFRKSIENRQHRSLKCKGKLSSYFEHDQLWIHCTCGASWSVNDGTGAYCVNGYCFEQVSFGDTYI